MAVTTLEGHVQRAIDFTKKSDVYFVLARKSSEWTEDDRTEDTPSTITISDSNPPVPISTSVLTDIQGYKKVETTYLVRPTLKDETPDISYQDSNWKIIPEAKAVSEGARWVYLTSTVAYDELPTDMIYRQVGILSGLVRSESAKSSGKYSLTPDEVESNGILELIDFRKPVYREADKREKLKVIIEF